MYTGKMRELSAAALVKGENDINETNDIVCRCRHVTDEHIIAAVRSGADTLEKVIDETGCCKGCGACAENVQRLIGEARTDREDGKGSFKL